MPCSFQPNANNRSSKLLENVELIEKLQQDKIAHTAEIDSLKQTISQLEKKTWAATIDVISKSIY